MAKKINISVRIGKLKLKNPVMTASGTFGYGLEFEDFLDLSKLGAIIVKGLASTPVKGNKPQRLVETPSGLINAIGLQNIGVESFLNDKMPLLKNCKTPVIVNVYGRTVSEYIKVAEKLEGTAIAAIELNISCPNVKKGGLQFASDRDAIKKMLSGIKKIYSKTVIVKLSPNTGNIEEIAKVCEDNGADSVSCINTLVGMAVDVKNRKPVLSNIFGGLSGPAIKPVALAMVHKVAKQVKIPVIGIGGIMNSRDAIEFIMAGAKAVQIGTANFRDPAAASKVIDGINDYMLKNKIWRIQSITNCLKY